MEKSVKGSINLRGVGLISDKGWAKRCDWPHYPSWVGTWLHPGSWPGAGVRRGDTAWCWPSEAGRIRTVARRGPEPRYPALLTPPPWRRSMPVQTFLLLVNNTGERGDGRNVLVWPPFYFSWRPCLYGSSTLKWSSSCLSPVIRMTAGFLPCFPRPFCSNCWITVRKRKSILQSSTKKKREEENNKT